MSTEHIDTVAQAGFALDEATGGVLIPLNVRKLPAMSVIVDLEDAERVAQYAWHPVRPSTKTARAIFYAMRSKYQVDIPLYMHRLIAGIDDPKVKIDHRNYNGLDNRRCNLRVVTSQQNNFNSRPHAIATSRFKGVSWAKSRKKWVAQIIVDGKHLPIGRFDHEIDAAVAYDRVAREAQGEFAYLNFPDVEAA